MPVRWDEVSVDKSKMRVYTAVPHTPRAPGVLVCHHGPGMDVFMLDVVHRLFREGYAVAAPDLYHRQPPDITDSHERMGMLVDDEIIADMDAAHGHLTKLSGCKVGPVGITGFCMGGRTTYMIAGVRTDLAAAAMFYGGRTKKAFNGTTTPFERTSKIGCPLIGFFGNDDTDPSPADVDALSAELTKHGKPHEFHRYDGTGHAFENFSNPDRYRPRAAEAAWGELLAFFREHLRPS
jgi:carboxymethylenebutenolidase